MRLRLGFAVAAHLDPDILIVDEVLAVGDAAFQKKCINAMGDLRSGGRTVLFVSHNMAAVENLCTRGIWIDSGSVREDGPAHKVIVSYMATSAAPDQATDLTNASARRGSGEIVYTRIEFLSPGGEVQRLTRSGDPLVIRLHFRAHKPIEFPSFGFRLFSEFGTLITDTSTWHHRLDFPLVPAGDGYIDLEIDALNLMPARYYFSLGLTGSGGVMHDWVDQCACIDVESANIYNSGRTLDSRSGVVFFPQRWRTHGLRSGAAEPEAAVTKGIAVSSS
jgi:lipopolysaccharide transport system ATP-binding protein